jgi:hypothetical protein
MKTLRAMVVALGLLLVVSAAKAQSTNVRANIPFDFVVGDQTMSAGNYLVSSIVEGRGITVRNTENRESKVILTQASEKLNPSDKTVLIFHRMGDEYFLSQIWVEGNTRGVSLPQSKTEKLMAKNHQEKQDVIVAALINR